MLVARMINDQVHDKFHPALVQAVQNSPECLHAAVFRRNVHVIRNIIDYVLIYDNEHIEIKWNFDDFHIE